MLVLDFGRWKGHAVHWVHREQPQYTRWLLAQPWVKSKFPELYREVRKLVLRDLQLEVAVETFL